MEQVCCRDYSLAPKSNIENHFFSLIKEQSCQPSKTTPLTVLLPLISYFPDLPSVHFLSVEFVPKEIRGNHRLLYWKLFSQAGKECPHH